MDFGVNCILCGKDAKVTHDPRFESMYVFNCRDCGHYGMPMFTAINAHETANDESKAYLRHLVFKHNSKHIGYMMISPELWNRAKVPSEIEVGVSEFFDRAILHLGDYQGNNPSTLLKTPERNNPVRIGALSARDANYVWEQLKQQGLTEVQDTFDAKTRGTGIRLTLAGWQRYGDLKRGENAGNFGFMAMKFEDKDVEHAYGYCFKPACERAGFPLRTVAELPRAGSIPEQIYNDVATAKFIICDLTNQNNGVYFEAGIGYGMKKVVIFTCEESHSDNCHFDIKVDHRLLWTPEKYEEIGEKITAMLRYHFPADAKMTNDE